MDNLVKDRFYEITDNVRNSLGFMREVANRLEILDDKNIEKIQCIEFIRDNIEILMTQIEEIQEYYDEQNKRIDYSSIKKFTDSFVMSDTRILIVDDNEINNYVVEQMLKRFKVEVDIALSGEEAIELFEQKDYDLILMDYLLPPGINGVETVKRIRESGKKGENQLIIGLTSNTIDEFKEGLNKYNVELILFKPIKYQQMAVILQKELADKVI